MNTRRRINGSGNKKVAKVTQQVLVQTAGGAAYQIQQCYQQAVKAVAKEQGTPIGEPRVYVIVEQDFVQ